MSIQRNRTGRLMSPGGFLLPVRGAVPAVGFVGALAVVTLTLGSQSATRQGRWLGWASTNLVNLRDHPIGALFLSTFIVEGYLALWMVLGLVGVAAIGLTVGGRRALLLVGTAHVVGTVVSEGVVAYRVSTGSEPFTDRHLIDVGPSYVVVCALVAAMAYARWPGRVLSGLGFAVVAPFLFGGLSNLEVSSVGHGCAVVVGLGLGYPLTKRPTVPRDQAPCLADTGGGSKG